MKFELPPEKRKPVLTAVAIAVPVLLLGSLFVTDTGKELLSSVSSMLGLGSSEQDMMAAMQALPPPPPPQKEAPAEEPVNEEAEALARALESGAVSLMEIMPGLQHEPAWKSLDKIAAWNAQPKSATKEAVYSYLQHDKLWVRLATLQFLAAHEELFADYADILNTTADQLVRTEHPSQVRRFLQRAESIDLELLSRMKKVLKI